jgi:putative ABC transport system permease protein
VRRPCCAPRSLDCASIGCDWRCSALAILLGVGFIAGTLIMGASMQQAFFNGFATGARNVDAAVTPVSSSKVVRPDQQALYVPAAVLDEVRGVSGTASTAGRVVGQVPLLGSNGKVIVNGRRGEGGVGINVLADPALRGFTVASGRVPGTPGEAVVDKASA